MAILVLEKYGVLGGVDEQELDKMLTLSHRHKLYSLDHHVFEFPMDVILLVYLHNLVKEIGSR